jgi:signal transduction histidine kinase
LIPLLALLFAGLLYWLGGNLKSTLYSANLESARHSNNMAVYAVETSMMTDDVHQPWDRIAQKIPRDEGSEIEIINADGIVLFSTAPTKRGRAYDLGDPFCSECHETGSTEATKDTAFISTPKSAKHLVYAAPLRNKEDCQNCHSTRGQKLGMVIVKQSLEPIHAQIRSIQVGIAIAGGIALLITMLTTRVLLGRHLGRPLRRLLKGARAIGAGNLQHAIELPERTELSVLADTLNASTARLAHLQRELVQRERLAAVGETVAGLAHCLKNLLNGLRAGQYVVDRAVELNDAERLRKGWRVMKSGVGQVERLTFDMLYYIKEREPEREPTSVNEVALEVIDLLDESARGHGVELHAELDSKIGEEALDRTLIYRAILNLVTNAIDACTETESGDLVTLRSRAAGPDEIVLTVEDNGIGMSEEIQSMLFTRFFSTKAGKGTGLGLSVVKKIAEEHGGRLVVESEPGKGSAFHVHFPRARS